MKSILVPISGSDTDAPLIEAAVAAAKPFSSHLQFLHVRLGAGEAALNVPYTGFAMGPALTDVLERLEHTADARSGAAERHFHDLCKQANIEICDVPGARPGLTATWRQVDGKALPQILFSARHSDLIVVGRTRKPNGLPVDFLEQLLVGCGRPILIATQAPCPTLTGTIMVCWRETAEAARALGGAMPLLTKAERVVVATVAERQEDGSDAMAQVKQHLAWNGVTAETQVIKAQRGDPAQLLATAAEACKADLVVLGAYGHSQFREMLFGGCTQSFLRYADRPVLMMH